MANDNLPAKFHLHPFIRFAGIQVSVQFGAKTQGWVTLGENFGKKGSIAVNWISALGRRRMGLSYGRDPTLISLLI